jgi:hypothetical protein
MGELIQVELVAEVVEICTLGMGKTVTVLFAVLGPQAFVAVKEIG